MAYKHGVYTSEQATSMSAPITGTAGLQVIVGTAPVNMLKNPAANQDEIAKASGFLSASAFNHKFKSVTGTSPRLWLIEKAIGSK